MIHFLRCEMELARRFVVCTTDARRHPPGHVAESAHKRFSDRDMPNLEAREDVMTKLSYAALLLALTVSATNAQAQSGSSAQILTSIPSDNVTVTHWYKQNVYDPQDNKIGEIMDVLVEGQQGKVTTLIVGVGGFLGMGEKDVAVPFN